MKAHLNTKKIAAWSLEHRTWYPEMCRQAGINFNTFCSQYYGRVQATLGIVLPLAMLMECEIEELIDVDWSDENERAGNDRTTNVM